MAKAFKVVMTTIAKAGCSKSPVSSFIANSSLPMKCLLPAASSTNMNLAIPRSYSTLSHRFGPITTLTASSGNLPHTKLVKKMYSSEVDNELAKFLEKEIQYETSRASSELPKIPGFEISTDGGDVTLTKIKGSEKVTVSLSVNGAVDSILAEDQEKQNEPPQMVCRPPFDVEISKGDGSVVAFQCSFPAPEEPFEDAEEMAKGDQDVDRIDDQFEIQEVAIHDGEWKETTFSVSAATMDAELFDLLMDMLDERGINDEFIAHMVDYCTAYENKQYINFLNKLKSLTQK